MGIYFQERYGGTFITRTGFNTRIPLREFTEKYCRTCPVRKRRPGIQLPLECLGMAAKDMSMDEAIVETNETGERYYQQFKERAKCLNP